MQLQVPSPALFFALCIALASGGACQDDEPTTSEETATERANPTHPIPAQATERIAALDPRSRLEALRARADTAFAEIERRGESSRTESHIGPQPWPIDLPPDWPEPDRGVLLADTRRADESRLLLIDLPGTPEQALTHYREALNERGFETRQPHTRRTLHVLHAQRGRWEAALTFIDRDRTTRLEILLIQRAAG